MSVALQTATAAVMQVAVLELAHALVADVADQHGVRYVVLKGLAAQRMGIQPVRPTSDVDVLLSEADAAVFGSELQRRGWLRRPADVDVDVFPRHSESWWHPAWSCDIDVHHRFPGIEGDPAVAFERMWTERVDVVIGGAVVPAPSHAMSTVVVALHALRSPWVPRHDEELRRLTRSSTLPPLDAVLEAARATGALACVRPFVEEAYRTTQDDWGTPSEEWLLRTTLPSPMARRIRLFVTSAMLRKAAFVRFALFPPRETLGKMDARTDLRGFALLAAYGRRWLRGVRALPDAVRELNGRR